MDPNNQNPTTPGPMPATEDAGVGVPVPPPTVPPVVEEPNAVPPPVVETKPKKKWGTSVLVGAIGAVLVLVVGVFVGTTVVTNLQEKVNLEKKAADECVLPAFDSVDECTQSCLAGCPLSSYPQECAAGCPSECVNLCAGGPPTNTCGNGACDAPGETSTNCPQDCGGGAPVAPPPTSGGNWNQCTSSTGPIPCGSCLVKSVEPGTMTFGCELNCGGSAGNCPGGSAGNYTIAHRWFHCKNKGSAPCGPGTGSTDHDGEGNLGGPGRWDISGQNLINGSGTFPNPGCGRVQVDVQMSASGTNVAGDVWDSEIDCGGGPPPSETPSPTPTPPPSGSAACQRLEYYREGALLPGGRNDIRVGDVIKVRGFASANNTTVSNIRFTINAGGTASVYSGTGLQLVGALWQADSPPITITATSYSISATPIFP